MRRFERRRFERRRRVVITVGLSVALGALTNEALTWRLHRVNGPARPTATSVPESEPAHEPLDPAGVERAADDDQLATAAQTPQQQSAMQSAIAALRRRDLKFPVEGIDRDDVRDTFSDTRGQGRSHEALDIMAPRGTPVRAVEDGTIAKLFESQGGGGLTIYQFDPSGTFCYYYAHLDGYAPGIREGHSVRRGQVVAYVGSTGNAAPDAPHLHFAIFQLTPERKWWKGEPLNPYPVFQ
jgi:murein DD-endopeptidase MepM/ murein hydrolase activator NlpD